MRKNLTIIIPVYNAHETLKDCLSSIYKQIEKGDEIIVVDDASLDDSVLIAEKFPDVKVLRLEKNAGPAAARNRGAELAGNEFIVFIDSDVVLKGDEFNAVTSYFEKHPMVDAVSGTLDLDLSPHNFFTEYKNQYMIYVLGSCDLEINFIYGSFCAVRKSSYEPWPVFPRLGEDSHWGYLLSKNQKIIHLLSSIKVIHLKKYDFISLLSNDFKIASNFAILFLKHKRWKTLYTFEEFGHTSKSQKLSLVTSAGAVCSFPFNIKASFVFFLVWLFLNYHLIKTFSVKKDYTFQLKVALWTFFDHLIYSAGIAFGMVRFVSGK